MPRIILNENICRKCWMSTHYGASAWWGDGDTQEFKRGLVFCPKQLTGKGEKYTYSTEPPPSWCPHKLEHGMAAVLEK